MLASSYACASELQSVSEELNSEENKPKTFQFQSETQTQKQRSKVLSEKENFFVLKMTKESGGDVVLSDENDRKENGSPKMSEIPKIEVPKMSEVSNLCEMPDTENIQAPANKQLPNLKVKKISFLITFILVLC